MSMQNKNKCDNCLKIFDTYWQLERHMLAIRQCKKVELDDSGNIIQSKEFKCDGCGELFTYKNTLNRHKRETCRNIITTNNTNNNNTTNNTHSHNDNSVKIDNSKHTTNHNHNDIDINIRTAAEHIKPKTEFEGIKDNTITVINVEKYIAKFKDIPITVETIVSILKDILVDKYVNNIPIEERNILTINSKYKMHYYKDEKWNTDHCYDYFVKNSIEKLLYQLDDAIVYKMAIIRKIDTNNIPYLLTYDFTMLDEELHKVVSEKTYNIEFKKFNEVQELSHKKVLDLRWKNYNAIHDILKNPIIVMRVLAIMKDQLNIDDELREIISKIPQLVN